MNLKTRPAPLQEGSEYAERWLSGARTLDEVAPDMARWVKRRSWWRGVKTVGLMIIGGLYLIALSFAIVGVLVSRVVPLS